MQRNLKAVPNTAPVPAPTITQIDDTHIEALQERLRQAMACVDAIDAVLLRREDYPDSDTITDRVLQGLASAAGALLRQAAKASEMDVAHG